MPLSHAHAPPDGPPVRTPSEGALQLLLLDNYDSYTYNLYQQLARLNGCEPRVARNDELTAAELAALPLDAIVISPGPGHPSRARDFGLCGLALQRSTPVLGVCLGHQGLAVAYGGQVELAAEPVHGRTSPILHGGIGLFEGIPPAFAAVRYHSLAVREPLPPCLEAIAHTPDGTLMALRHRDRPQWGVQFHPESIGTEHGDRLIANFLAMARATTRGHGSGSRSSEARPSEPVRSATRSRARPARAPGPQCQWQRLPRWVSPEDAFVHLFGAQPHAFWLDSARAGDAASRYSFMGAPSRPGDRIVRYFASRRELVIEQDGALVRHDDDLLSWLDRRRVPRPSPGPPLPCPLRGGYVGYFGYGLHGGPAAREPATSPLPDATLLGCRSHLAFDHHAGAVYAVAEADDPAQARRMAQELAAALEGLPPAPAVRSEGGVGPVEFRLARGHAEYLQDIEACLREIRRGETYEVCLTTQLLGPSVERPLDAYRILRARNPAPYGAYLRLGPLAVLSCSPELLLRVDPCGHVLTKPIKGTAPRGATSAEDEALRRRLAASIKDRAENLMIVDLLRNDLGRVCEVGSVQVPELMAVESFETVHQLVSTVSGTLRPEHTVIDCLRAAFPGGSMTGAPKLRTMEIIAGLEPSPRGIYSGCLGYLSSDGAAQLAMTIRTAVVTPQQTSIGVGGAIVALSDPRAELDELLLKGRAVLGGIAAAKTGQPGDAVVVGAGLELSSKSP